MRRHSRRSTLFPYTTLFRSQAPRHRHVEQHQIGRRGLERTEQGRGVVRLTRNRSEEHTSELQSREKLVCRLLLEKKKSRESTNCRPVMNRLNCLSTPAS